MFCFKCGSEIPDESVFCSKCGTKVAQAEPAASDNKLFKLTIDRKSQLYAVNPPIKISIDSSILLSVDNGKTIQTELPSGKHIIEFSASMRKSRMEIDMDKDMLIQVSFSRLTGKIIAEVL